MIGCNLWFCVSGLFSFFLLAAFSVLFDWITPKFRSKLYLVL